MAVQKNKNIYRTYRKKKKIITKNNFYQLNTNNLFDILDDVPFKKHFKSFFSKK